MHVDELTKWAGGLSGGIVKKIHLLDVFGATQGVSKAWREAGFFAEAFDVKISPDHDLCTYGGFKSLLTMGLECLRQVVLNILNLLFCLCLHIVFSRNCGICSCCPVFPGLYTSYNQFLYVYLHKSDCFYDAYLQRSLGFGMYRVVCFCGGTPSISVFACPIVW